MLKRTRLCNQPPPMNGGKTCVGNNTETARSCFTPCPGLAIIESKMIYIHARHLACLLKSSPVMMDADDNNLSYKRHIPK